MTEKEPIQAVAPQQQDQQEPQQQQSTFSNLFSTALKFMVIWLAFSWITSKSRNPTVDLTSSNNQQRQTNSKAELTPIWSLGQILDLAVYTSETPYFDSFNDESAVIWKESGIRYGDFDDQRVKDITLEINENIQNNGSLFAHIFLHHQGSSPNPQDISYNVEKSIYICKCEYQTSLHSLDIYLYSAD